MEFWEYIIPNTFGRFCSASQLSQAIGKLIFILVIYLAFVTYSGLFRKSRPTDDVGLECGREWKVVESLWQNTRLPIGWTGQHTLEAKSSVSSVIALDTIKAK